MIVAYCFLTFMLVFVFVLAGLSKMQSHSLSSGKARAMTPVETKTLPPKGYYSWPAMQVFNAFKHLPEANRPAYDIGAMLSALDVKYDKDEVNNHFTAVPYNRYNFSDIVNYDWSCFCVRQHRRAQRQNIDLGDKEFKCSMPEYAALNKEIGAIASVLREQEKAQKDREHRMVLAGLEPELNMVEELMTALRNERSVIVEVTKEIKGA